MPADAPRTLADQLRGWSDDHVARLLVARPECASRVREVSRVRAGILGGEAFTSALQATAHAAPARVSRSWRPDRRWAT